MELTAIINKINSFLWGVPLLILLLGGGIYLSICLLYTSDAADD